MVEKLETFHESFFRYRVTEIRVRALSENFEKVRFLWGVWIKTKSFQSSRVERLYIRGRCKILIRSGIFRQWQGFFEGMLDRLYVCCFLCELRTSIRRGICSWRGLKRWAIIRTYNRTSSFEGNFSIEISIVVTGRVTRNAFQFDWWMLKGSISSFFFFFSTRVFVFIISWTTRNNWKLSVAVAFRNIDWLWKWKKTDAKGMVAFKRMESVDRVSPSKIYGDRVVREFNFLFFARNCEDATPLTVFRPFAWRIVTHSLLQRSILLASFWKRGKLLPSLPGRYILQ